MTVNLMVAAAQMDAALAPKEARLQRAEALAAAAAQAEAQLLVLPELFNTGYAYTDENYASAEPPDGLTMHWLRAAAARFNLHLAGTWLVREAGEIYNRMVLASPAGRSWRYDKNYPWAWERRYFRPGQGVTIANTSLGSIGMLVCWDVGHRALWQQYAGKVDLILVSSCSPDFGAPRYHLPSNKNITLEKMGPLASQARGAVRRVFAEMLPAQLAWLGVPAVHAQGCGQITTPIPNGTAALLGLLPSAPWLVKYLPQASALQVTCSLAVGCEVLDAAGNAIARLEPESGEGIVTAPLALSSRRPEPQGAQPPSRLPGFIYLVSDEVLPSLGRRSYNTKR